MRCLDIGCGMLWLWFGHETPVDATGRSVQQVLQDPDSLDEAFCSFGCEEFWSTAGIQTAHETQQKEDVKAQRFNTISFNAFLKLAHVGGNIFTLQHLGQVEHGMQVQGTFDILQACSTQALDWRHHIVKLLDQVQDNTLWAPFILWALTSHCLGLSKRAYSQEHQHGMKFFLRWQRKSVLYAWFFLLTFLVRCSATLMFSLSMLSNIALTSWEPLSIITMVSSFSQHAHMIKLSATFTYRIITMKYYGLHWYTMSVHVYLLS